VSGEADLGTTSREAGDRQVENLERDGSLNTGKPVLCFWKASESSVCGFAGVNDTDESWRGSVGTERREEDPEEAETQEGRGTVVALTGAAVTALQSESEDLEFDDGRRGAGNRSAGHPTKRRSQAGETRCGSGWREKSLKGEPWTRLQDETSLQGSWRSKPSRACETPRAERRSGWIPIGLWTPAVDVVKRDETPRKALPGVVCGCKADMRASRGRIQGASCSEGNAKLTRA
jgi:hypothetical protein